MEILLVTLTIAAVLSLVVTLQKLKASRNECADLKERVQKWEELWDEHEKLYEEPSQR